MYCNRCWTYFFHSHHHHHQFHCIFTNVYLDAYNCSIRHTHPPPCIHAVLLLTATFHCPHYIESHNSCIGRIGLVTTQTHLKTRRMMSAGVAMCLSAFFSTRFRYTLIPLNTSKAIPIITINPFVKTFNPFNSNGFSDCLSSNAGLRKDIIDPRRPTTKTNFI